MTVTQPLLVPKDRASDANMFAPCHNMFHDYASPPQPSASDHSLQMELQMYTASPSSLTMYEPELCDMPGSLRSAADEGFSADLSQLDNCDLKPQLDCSNENFLRLDIDSINASYDDIGRGDPVWSPTDPGLLKIPEGAFQGDNTILKQGPTLAELNGEENMSVLDDIESVIAEDWNGDFKTWKWGSPSNGVLTKLPKSNSTHQTTCTITKPCTQTLDAKDQSVADTPKVMPSSYPLPERYSASLRNERPLLHAAGSRRQEESPTMLPSVDMEKGALHQILSQMRGSSARAAPVGAAPAVKPEGLPVPGMKRSFSPETSSNSSVNSMDRKWEEIKQFIHQDEPPAFHIKKIKEEPKDVAFEPKDDVESNDEGFNSDNNDNSDEEEDRCDDDFLSETESLDSHSSYAEEYRGPGRKDKRYFWQYNIQSKGPKGKRLCKSVNTSDPHVLGSFEDPVFDPELNDIQYKHNGKVRRGDGNDVTPSPKKLYQIGNELKRLNRTINDLTPVSELPVNVRSRSRKEKNKLASRACRLKKKAQHEANKLKLYGLEKEHYRLMVVLGGIKEEVKKRLTSPDKYDGEGLSAKLDKLTKKHLTHMIAGHTAEYVNTIIAKVAAGDPTGGLRQ